MRNHRVESSTHGGGFCLCRRGFNRRVDGGKSPGGWGEITDWNLQPAEAGFVCVDAVSTAGWMGGEITGWMGGNHRVDGGKPPRKFLESAKAGSETHSHSGIIDF